MNSPYSYASTNTVLYSHRNRLKDKDAQRRRKEIRNALQRALNQNRPDKVGAYVSSVFLPPILLLAYIAKTNNLEVSNYGT